ncbi:MAG: M1 family metallopeptidase [Chloroflexi bacterium]|nr:M1 family metallopeptidase [Chloroflexota bacterium]
MRQPRRRAVRHLALTLGASLVVALASVGGSGPVALAIMPVEVGPGARSVGDPFYPTLGNGGYDVTSYDLDLTWHAPDAAHPTGWIAGVATIDIQLREHLTELSLDLRRDTTEVSSVRVGGVLARHRADGFGRKLIIEPPDLLQAARTTRLRIEWTARPAPVHRLGEELGVEDPDGLDRADARGFLADGDGGFFLASQPNGAHTLFPSNDHPTDPAPVRVRLTAPAGMLGVATGRRIEEVAHPDGSTTTTWVSDDPVATHVLAMGVGRSTLIEDDIPGGPHLRSVVPTALAPFAEHRLAVLPEVVTWLEDAIGRPYPFRTLGLQLVPPGATGAILEGQTLILAGAGMLDPRLSECAWTSLMVHEVAHQWFGDSVAIARWDQKWLSEGHATYYEQLWEAESGCDALGRDRRFRRLYAGAQAARDRGGPPDRPRAPRFAYDATIYAQGALALEALRREVGDERFRAIETTFLDRFRGRSASTDDYIDTASEIAGRDLRPFLEAWLRDDQVPRLPAGPSPSARPSSSVAPASPAEPTSSAVVVSASD